MGFDPLHGGRWSSGSGSQFPRWGEVLSSHGYSVVSISYRLAPVFRWPAQRADANLAIDYVKKHAVELGVDPHSYFLMGRSAGAQIAGVIARSRGDADLRGLIVLYPPADLVHSYESRPEDDIISTRQILRDYLGGSPKEVPNEYVDASFVGNSESVKVPTLILHGSRDTLVSRFHSEALITELRRNGVPASFVEIPWAQHGFDRYLSGPAGQVALASTLYFLNLWSEEASRSGR